MKTVQHQENVTASYNVIAVELSKTLLPSYIKQLKNRRKCSRSLEGKRRQQSNKKRTKTNFSNKRNLYSASITSFEPYQRPSSHRLLESTSPIVGHSSVLTHDEEYRFLKKELS